MFRPFLPSIIPKERIWIITPKHGIPHQSDFGKEHISENKRSKYTGMLTRADLKRYAETCRIVKSNLTIAKKNRVIFDFTTFGPRELKQL